MMHKTYFALQPKKVVLAKRSKRAFRAGF